MTLYASELGVAIAQACYVRGVNYVGGRLSHCRRTLELQAAAFKRLSWPSPPLG